MMKHYSSPSIDDLRVDSPPPSDETMMQDPAHHYEHFMDQGYAAIESGLYSPAISNMTLALHYAEEAKRSPFFAHYNIGLSHYKNRDLDQAITSLIECQKHPCRNDDIQAAREYLGRAYKRRGDQWMEAGNITAAVNDYSRAIEQNPDCSYYHKRAWARTHLNPQPMGEIIQDLLKVNHLSPDDHALNQSIAEAFSTYGTDLLEAGHLVHAKTHFQSAVNFAPDKPKYAYQFADALLQAGQLDDAVKNTIAVNKNFPGTSGLIPERLLKACSFINMLKNYRHADVLRELQQHYKQNPDGMIDNAPIKSHLCKAYYDTAMQIDKSTVETINFATKFLSHALRLVSKDIAPSFEPSQMSIKLLLANTLIKKAEHTNHAPFYLLAYDQLKDIVCTTPYLTNEHKAYIGQRLTYLATKLPQPQHVASR